MEQLIVVIIEVFFEILLNVIGNGLFDWPTQGRARSRQGESIGAHIGTATRRAIICGNHSGSRSGCCSCALPTL
jgi:hypothetical protein